MRVPSIALVVMVCSLASGSSAQRAIRGRAETTVRCTMRVEPFVVDDATGERARASIERFELRPAHEGDTVAVVGDGWVVSSARLRIDYDLVDRWDGRVVLRDSVEMSCGRPPPDARRDVIDLVSRRVYRGVTVTREATDERGSCGGDEGPEQWYRLVLDDPAHVSLRLVSEFDATLYVREGAIGGSELACSDRSARLERFEMNLRPGVYYVAVDGSGTHGTYRLVAFVDPIDARAIVDVPRAIEAGLPVSGELVPMPSAYASTCGGEGGPEHVYAFRLAHRSVVSLRLASHFDPALYLLDADGVELDCASALGVRGSARRTRVTTELPAGLYYAVVDAESERAGTGRYEMTMGVITMGGR